MTNAKCNTYCANFGCQGATNCPARSERIHRAMQVGVRQRTRQRTFEAFRVIFGRVALVLLFALAVACVSVLTGLALDASKP